MSSSKIYPKIEGDSVYLKRNSSCLGGISSTNLGTDAKSILDSYIKMAQKYDLTPEKIGRIIGIVLAKGRIIDFGGDILSFCYRCNYLEEIGIGGVSNLVKSFARRKAYTDILSDIFVAEIAARYATEHRVELRVRKKENGCDLIIDDLKCDCKIRMGWFDPGTKDLSYSSMDKEKPLDRLMKNETERVMMNRVIEAFLKQDADVVFVDTTRTSIGFSLLVNLSDSNEPKPSSFLPMLRKHMVIFYARLNENDLWASACISPERINLLKTALSQER